MTLGGAKARLGRYPLTGRSCLLGISLSDPEAGSMPLRNPPLSVAGQLKTAGGKRVNKSLYFLPAKEKTKRNNNYCKHERFPKQELSQ